MIERYTRPRMAQLWSATNRFQKWLEVELLACEAWAKLGVIPAEEVAELRARAFTVDEAFVRRVAEIEETTRHDVIAFTTACAERIDHPAEHLVADGNRKDLAGLLDRIAFLDVVRFTHEHHAEVVFVNVEGNTLQSAWEFQQL